MNQAPLRGIMEISGGEQSRAFRIACECTDSRHDLDAWVEVDSDHDDQTVTVSFIVQTVIPWRPSFLNRIRTALSVLWSGTNTQSHELMLSEIAARNFATALVKTADELRQGAKR